MLRRTASRAHPPSRDGTLRLSRHMQHACPAAAGSAASQQAGAHHIDHMLRHGQVGTEREGGERWHSWQRWWQDEALADRWRVGCRRARQCRSATRGRHHQTAWRAKHRPMPARWGPRAPAQLLAPAVPAGCPMPSSPNQACNVGLVRGEDEVEGEEAAHSERCPRLQREAHAPWLGVGPLGPLVSCIQNCSRSHPAGLCPGASRHAALCHRHCAAQTCVCMTACQRPAAQAGAPQPQPVAAPVDWARAQPPGLPSLTCTSKMVYSREPR